MLYNGPHVNVCDCEARIMYDATDITALIPDGEKLAMEAVKENGGAINISGLYPPNIKILRAINERIDIIKEIVKKDAQETKKRVIAYFKARWEKYRNEVFKTVKQTVYKDVALDVIDLVKRNNAAQSAFEILLEEEAFLTHAEEGKTYEEIVNYWASRIGVENWPQFPDSLKPMAEKVAGLPDTLDGPVEGNEQELAKFQKFFAEYPEFGHVTLYKIASCKRFKVVKSLVFKQYQFWGFWLKNKKSKEKICLGPVF